MPGHPSGPSTTHSPGCRSAPPPLPQGSAPSASHRPLGCALVVASLLLSTALAALSLSLHPGRPSHPYLRHRLLQAGPSSNSPSLLSIVCSHAIYPDVCLRELSGHSLAPNATPFDIAKAAICVTALRANQARAVASSCSSQRGLSRLEGECADDCVELLNDLIDDIRKAVARMTSLNPNDVGAMPAALADVKVWLSSALAYQTACSDNFQVAPGSIQTLIQSDETYLGEVIGFTLSIVDLLARIGDNSNAWLGALPPAPSFVKTPHLHRRLLSIDAPFEVDDGFPQWVSVGERRLLQAPSSSAAASANAVVAIDGTGQFTSIVAALNAIPNGYSERYVIYIKQGVYNEIFNLTASQQNITFIGDGIDLTIITGSRNVASGNYTTYRSSTVGISGAAFYARGITFRNTAGPAGHQAVALRAGADYLVFYRCSFESYQDTLYALASRQFYRECVISGTVDFIFGNAIAVFQNCVLVARVPLQGQQNTYTAQGRKLAADVSGYSFQNCTLTGEAALASLNFTVGTYLGRPWKEYSRVVFLESELQGLVNPSGWLPWNASNPYTDTVYYGEYNNRGGGANTAQRVNWTGVHPNMSQADASLFTVANFIGTESWLDYLAVTYQDTL